ncbi:MAG: FG-GAP-like repeat-containing protein [candidate division Zixibacteria bacterium]|nr:FG-GAP-like repeat-containing protein [candidate division Zixibacteria bacterium]
MKRFLVLLLFALAFCTPAFAQFDMQQMAVMQGPRDTVYLGATLSGVGDINQDGFEDLAVGQRRWNTFIYFGSKNFDTIPDVTFSSFSYHISHGDINGDGLSDLLLTPMGKIYIYYGGIDFDTIPDDSVVNNATYFGWNFACGDINGDGYDDIAGWSEYNKVFVYLGGAKISTQPVYLLQGSPNYFGIDGLAIGDINGDDYGDLAVSTSERYPVDTTYIYFGGIELDTIPRVKLIGGGVVLGDMNGDGYTDLITTKGTYLGGTAIDSVLDIGIRSNGCNFANAYTVVGRFDKDRYEDLLLGSTSIGGGDALIYLGGDPLDTTQDWHYYDGEVGDYGAQVGTADINGDGVDEAIVGDPGWWYNNPSYPPGRVYIYKNPYTAVKDEEQQLPFTFTLGQNYPNPFNRSTTIPFELGSKEQGAGRPIHTTLIIYNILGQKVRTLLDEERFPGNHQVIWDGKNYKGEIVGSDIYFYRIQAGSFTKTAKMNLLK